MADTQRTHGAAGDHQTRAFCPNCGHTVAADAKFCQHCGYDLTATARRSAQQKRRVPAAWWIGLVVLVILLGGGYAYGRNYFSPEHQLDRAISAIEAGQPTAQFTSSDPDLKLSAKTLKPLLAHFKAKSSSLATFKRQLHQQSATNDGRFQYVRTGRTWLVFARYQIRVDPVYVSLTTNHKNVQLKVNHQLVATSDDDTFQQKVGPLVPGDYELSASGIVGGHEMQNVDTYYLNRDGLHYDLDLRTISFNVVGVPGTMVYLNGESQGTIGDGGTLAIKDAAWSSQLKLIGKYPVGKSMVTSKTTHISAADEDQDLAIDFPSLMTNADADDYLAQLFQAISNYTSSGDIEDATDDHGKKLATYFVDGTANKDYQEFVDMAKEYHHNEDILSVEYTPKVTLSVPAADQQSQVTYEVKYNFFNTKDEREQVFGYTATIQKHGDDYQIVKITPAQKLHSKTTDYETDDD